MRHLSLRALALVVLLTACSGGQTHPEGALPLDEDKGPAMPADAFVTDLKDVPPPSAHAKDTMPMPGKSSKAERKGARKATKKAKKAKKSQAKKKSRKHN